MRNTLQQRYATSLQSGTVHRIIQDFEDDSELAGQEEGRSKQKQDVSLSCLRYAAAEVVQSAEKERHELGATFGTTAKTAAGTAIHQGAQAHAASARVNSITRDAQLAKALQEVAEEVTAIEHHHRGVDKVADAGPPAMSRKESAKQASLAVVIARANMRDHLEACGETLHDTEIEELQRTQTAMRMHQFPLRAGNPRQNVQREEDLKEIERSTSVALPSLSRSLSRAASSTVVGHSLSRLPSHSGSSIRITEQHTVASVASGMLSRLRTGSTRSGFNPGGSTRWLSPSFGGMNRSMSSFGALDACGDWEEDVQLTAVGKVKRKSTIGPTGRPSTRRDTKMETIISNKRPADWREQLLVTYPEFGLPADRMNKRLQICRGDFGGGKSGREGAEGGERDGEEDQAEEPPEVLALRPRRLCPTCAVSPILPKDIDDEMRSVHADGVSIRWPAADWAPPVQLWEPFVISAILSLPFFQDFHGNEREADVKLKGDHQDRFSWHEKHVEKLLQFSKKVLRQTFPCPLLKEHVRHPYVQVEDSRFVLFLVAFLRKKFEPFDFKADRLSAYMKHGILDALSSPDGRTVRAFITSPFVLDFIKDEPESIFEGQYKDMIKAASSVGVKMFNVVKVVAEKRARLTKLTWSAVIEQRTAPDLDFDQVHVYLDNGLIPRRHGGCSLTPSEPVQTKIDSLLIRKVGATIEDIVAGKNVLGRVSAGGEGPKKSRAEMAKELRAALARKAADQKTHQFFSEADLGEHRVDQSTRTGTATTGVEDDDSDFVEDDDMNLARKEWEDLLSHCLDPEGLCFMPLGFSITETFLLIRGLVLAMDQRPDADHDGMRDIEEGSARVLRTDISNSKDRHLLAAALLIDLYMREKVNVWAWQLDGEPPGSRGPSNASDQDAVKLSDNPWTGPISHVYRIFHPQDAPYWTTEAPLYPGAVSVGAAHWLEPYVQVAEEIFMAMEIPPDFGEDIIWDSLLDRRMLIPSSEDADTYRIPVGRLVHRVAQSIPGLQAVTRTIGGLCGCCRRARPGSSEGLWDVDCETGSQRLSGEARERKTVRHERLELYDMLPKDLPRQVVGGPVGRWIDELQARRSATTVRDGGGSFEDVYHVKDHVQCFNEQSGRWTTAKVVKVSRGWVTVAFKGKDGKRKSRTLPEGHQHLRLKVKKEPRSSDELAKVDEQATVNPSGDPLQDGKKHDVFEEHDGVAGAREPDGVAAMQNQDGDEEADSGDDDALDGGGADASRHRAAARSQSSGVARESVSFKISEGSDFSAMEDLPLQEWWERFKLLYSDAYFLMFEEGVMYYEEEQEVALWRAQVLMFFFVLQILFEAAWDCPNGLERAFQAICPPFAKLPLRPPKGMEASAAVIRGIVERARLAGDYEPDDGLRNLVEEAGNFQERIREAFERQLCECADISEMFDSDGDGDLTMREFADGLNALPEKHKLQVGGVPRKVLDHIIRDLSTELFCSIDEDGDGVLSCTEIQAAIKARRETLAPHGHDTNALRQHWKSLLRNFPGTEAHAEWQEMQRRKLAREREQHKNVSTMLKLRRQNSLAQRALSSRQGTSRKLTLSVVEDQDPFEGDG